MPTTRPRPNVGTPAVPTVEGSNMIKVNDTLRVQGGVDRFGAAVPATTWTVVALDRIDGSGMYAALAVGDRFGCTVWLAGRVDAVGRPGHQPEAVRAGEAAVWVTESIARDDHADRITGDVW